MIKVLLIGGTSHVGKSTLGQQLAKERGWDYLSTDQLARHPGRPWRDDMSDLPSDVVEHYSSLSPPELLDSVLTHYTANVSPIVEAIVHSRLNNDYDRGLVLEGSAILPDVVAKFDQSRVEVKWLTLAKTDIRKRILESSDYQSRSTEERQLIDTFVERSILFDKLLEQSVTFSTVSNH